MEKIMSSKKLYQLGGIAAIASVLREIVVTFVPDDVIDNLIGSRYSFYLLHLLSYILILLVILALHNLYASESPKLSFVTLIIATIGTITLLIGGLVGNFPHTIFISALLSNQIVPILLFGVLAYKQPQVGMPRILAVIGILYALDYFSGLFLNLSLWDIMNYLPLTLFLVWVAWTGYILLFGKLQESSEKNIFANPLFKRYRRFYYLTIIGTVAVTLLTALVITLLNKSSASFDPSIKGTVKGTLVHANGIPFKAGESVMVGRLNYFEEICESDIETYVSTDETGSFVLSDIPAGKYCLLISDSNHTMREILLSDNQTYFTFEITDTTPVNLGQIEADNLFEYE
jgi:hypothetical protein